ncbi:uncharacterized protein PHALS_15262 [Plasmopara halstedii]|uniref:Secreted protein n=1 Tax=Plasmopara halstedii TaxID=4781 RepID=A0A0N7L8L5_PLAHL|nr:uncharacterized protein PHALS_15262 [Plasmopara halstedii]CEG50211.1 hypothetical protein PHALS_15262 [Plasmopara halstedii]|eukprot:XP_024586580.1 hypothetical protein PHALS_15262 [Plasmopara halstedii]
MLTLARLVFVSLPTPRETLATVIVDFERYADFCFGGLGNAVKASDIWTYTFIVCNVSCRPFLVLHELLSNCSTVSFAN